MMTILIPAYEPTEKMLKLVSELREKTDYDILLVDDGSGAGYRDLFNRGEALGCKVLRHAENKGKGEALKTGFAALAAEEGMDAVVCADSDGQHLVDDIIRLANAVNRSKSEMVLGVRQFDGKVPFKSCFGNRMSSFFFKLATGIHVTDTQTGLRAYPDRLLPWLLSIKGNRFEYELNLLLRAKMDGVSIRQLPITTIYEKGNKGTHFRPVHDSIRVLAPLLKFCGSSILSGVLDFVLLFVFQWLTGSLFWGVALARMVSSLFNYTINKILVFDAKTISNKQSAPRYFSLVLVIMLLNYAILSFLTKHLGFPDIPSKLLTEIILFILSYNFQKLLIFKKTGRHHGRLKTV